MDDSMSRDALVDLVVFFSKTTFKASDSNPKLIEIQDKCLELFSKDYEYTVLNNSGGCLCAHYPSKIIVCERAKNEIWEKKVANSSSMKDMFSKSRMARCRSRFVVPVLLYDDKSICRSATLASAPELYGRSGYDFLFAGSKSKSDNDLTFGMDEKPDGDWDLLNKIRGSDVKLLKELSVKYILDLMVEQKKVKFGMNVTSSEKADKANRYSDFRIASVPYPGCEFFRDFKSNCYSGEGIYFDWNQTFVDAHLNIPHAMPHPKHVDWKKYKSWDLVTLTQNYLLFILMLLKEGDGSVLIHCISGWDRTPLFISLLRLTLWADERAHKSLTASEILYLTIAYDWLLFGHDLEDRLTKGEEVFFFCFNFLKHIVSEEFSINIERSYSLQHLKPKHRTLSFTQFENILLDTSDHSRTSSSASLCSINSCASERNVCAYDSIFESGEHAQVSRSSSHSSRNGSASSLPSVGVCKSSIQSNFSSITMPVPLAGAVCPPVDRCSPCGSWQLISGTGSPRGTTSAKDFSAPIARSCSASSLSDTCEDMCTTRQRKLEAVRSLFHFVYAASVGYDNGRYDQNPGGLTSIIDQVASKMIKATWITSV